MARWRWSDRKRPSIVPLGAGAVEPVSGAMWSCDEAISTHSYVDNELALSNRPRHSEKDTIARPAPRLEQSILRLHHLDWSRTLFVIVCHVIDPRAHR
jgi:hypothetical protein